MQQLTLYIAGNYRENRGARFKNPHREAIINQIGTITVNQQITIPRNQIKSAKWTANELGQIIHKLPIQRKVMVGHRFSVGAGILGLKVTRLK